MFCDICENGYITYMGDIILCNKHRMMYDISIQWLKQNEETWLYINDETKSIISNFSIYEIEKDHLWKRKRILKKIYNETQDFTVSVIDEELKKRLNIEKNKRL